MLGPTKGGIRYDAHVSLGRVRGARDVDDLEVRAAAAALRRREGRRSLQPAGALAGEVERLTRRFTTELLHIIGPQEDIPAPDMATNAQTMAWIMDTYSMQVGYAVPEIVTGKPISIGGSVFRNEATGAGVVMVIERACQRLGWTLAEQRCVVQGFGNVGGVAARDLAARGGAGARGLRHLRRRPRRGRPRPRRRRRLGRRAWLARGLPGGEHVSNEELLELPCDILVLAALEDQLTGENAGRIDTKMIAEGANGPTSLDADAILAERGIIVLPDILTNAGGVTVSYFEWVQDLGRLFWDADEIRARLADKLNDAFDRVWELAEQQDITLRSAALVGAIREVAGALEARGIYP